MKICTEISNICKSSCYMESKLFRDSDGDGEAAGADYDNEADH